MTAGGMRTAHAGTAGPTCSRRSSRRTRLFPVLGGRLALGTWQSIALVDVNVDNPDRQVRLSFLSDTTGRPGVSLPL